MRFPVYGSELQGRLEGVNRKCVKLKIRQLDWHKSWSASRYFWGVMEGSLRSVFKFQVSISNLASIWTMFWLSQFRRTCQDLNFQLCRRSAIKTSSTSALKCEWLNKRTFPSQSMTLNAKRSQSGCLQLRNVQIAKSSDISLRSE